MVCRAGSNYSGADVANYRGRNWNADISFTPANLAKPNDLESLVEVIAKATEDGRAVHAIGSGWAFEDCAKSDGIMVSLEGLNKQLHYVVDTRTLLDSHWTAIPQTGPGSRLVHFEAGIRIADLCEQLNRLYLAMPTLGGSNGQALAGVISTSTHGGDWNQPPFPDVVRAIHLVTEGGRELWIEGTTRPLTRADADAELLAVLPCGETRIIRDDQILDAARVACGRFGVIYSVVLEVRMQFRVAQVITTPSRASVMQALRDGQGTPSVFTPLFRLLNNTSLPANMPEGKGVPYFLQVLFNSQRPDDVWVTRRWESDDLTLPEIMDPSQGSQLGTAIAIVAIMNGVVGFAAGTAGATLGAIGTIVGGLLGGPVGATLGGSIGSVSASVAISEAVVRINALLVGKDFSFGRVVAAVLNTLWKFPGVGAAIPEVEYLVLNGRLGPQVNSVRRGPHYLMTSGTRADSDSTDVRVDSIELVFDAMTTDYLDFLDDILAVAPSFQQAGYVSLRPSLSSSALLSMHHVRSPRAISIEISTLKDLPGNLAWMAYVHQAAVRRNGRPHWGQYNKLQALDTEMLYGDSLNQWREALLRVSGTSTVFSNAFTLQRGLEPMAIVREVTSVKKVKGTITHICNDLAAWSPVAVAQAVADIQAGTFKYVARSGNAVALIQVVSNGHGGFFLRTQPDATAADNLDNLPLSMR